MSYSRIQELRSAAEKGELYFFLETITSVLELETIEKIVLKYFKESYIEAYFKKLSFDILAYSGTKQIGWAKEKYPLSYARLSKPGGNIAFRRFLHLWTSKFQDENLLDVSEHILKKVAEGASEVEILPREFESGTFKVFPAELLAWWTDYSVEALRRFLFPDLESSGEDYACNWKFKKERVEA